jgi:hypothetical protein
VVVVAAVGMSITISSFVETMAWIAMRGVHGNLVSAILKPNSGVHYQPFSTPDSEVGVNEKDALFPGGVWRPLGHV